MCIRACFWVNTAAAMTKMDHFHSWPNASMNINECLYYYQTWNSFSSMICLTIICISRWCKRKETDEWNQTRCVSRNNEYFVTNAFFFCIAITIGISDFTRGCTQRLISLSLNRSRLIVSEWSSRPHCPVMKRIFPERSSQWFPMFFIFTAARYSPPIMKGKTISIMPLSGSAYTI